MQMNLSCTGALCAAVVALSGCAKDTPPAWLSTVSSGADAAPVATPRPSVQPLLTSVGDEWGDEWLNTTFDVDGYPQTMELEGGAWSFRLTWSGGLLLSASAAAVSRGAPEVVSTAHFFYAQSGVVRMVITDSPAPLGPDRSVTLDYTAAGALATWTTAAGTDQYSYDEKGWLRSIVHGGAAPFTETFVEDDDGCPTSMRAGTASFMQTFTASFSNRRLTKYSGIESPGEPNTHAVEYDGDGRITGFGSAGAPRLTYGVREGEARGINLFPGIFLGDFGSGFPAHGELLRLDGTCDPTLASQATILSLLLRALPRPPQ